MNRLDKLRLDFKKKRMEATGVGVFWTPKMVNDPGHMRFSYIKDIKWQTKRNYKPAKDLLSNSSLNTLRERHGVKLLALSMRGAETWLIEKNGHELILKQEPRIDSYVWEKNALLVLNKIYFKDVFPRLLEFEDKQQNLLTNYFSGKVLSDYKPQDFSNLEKLEIVEELFKVFNSLHEMGIAHLDLVPRKIKYDEQTKKMRLIDFGSCGIGESIENVLTGHLRNKSNPQSARYHRAPELVYRQHINGRLADRYGLASLIYWLYFETIDPLIEAATPTGFWVDPEILLKKTRQLGKYTENLMPLLQALCKNFDYYPGNRIVTEDQILAICATISGKAKYPTVEKSHPVVSQPTYKRFFETVEEGSKYIFLDMDNTIFKSRIHDLTMLRTGLSKDKRLLKKEYDKYYGSNVWREKRLENYIYPVSEKVISDAAKKISEIIRREKLIYKGAIDLLNWCARRAINIVIISGGPRLLHEEIMSNLIKHNKKMLDLKLTTLGTEYDFIDGSVAITFEGYSDTKGAVIKEVVKRKGKPILGIGDSLYNDKFLHEVEKNNGEVIIISKVDPELSWKIVDSWTKNYDNQRN